MRCSTSTCGDPDGRTIQGIPHELSTLVRSTRRERLRSSRRRVGNTPHPSLPNMAGRRTDILLGGSAEGLARRALKENLWPVLGLDLEDALLMHVELSPLTEQTLNQATISAIHVPPPADGIRTSR